MVIDVEAISLTRSLDMKKVAGLFPDLNIVWKNPLIVETDTKSYLAITSFGAVAFWNYNQQRDQALLKRIVDQTSAETDPRTSDSIRVDPEAGHDEATFEEIRLCDASAERIFIVLFCICQSAALERVELEFDRILEELEPIIKELRHQGNIKAGSKQLLKTVGFSMDMQSEVMSGLSLLDRPGETWESEALDRLYDKLFDYFDVATRRSALYRKIDFIENTCSVIMGVIDSRTSTMLEIVIIVLIAFEVLMAFLPGMPKG